MGRRFSCATEGGGKLRPYPQGQAGAETSAALKCCRHPSDPAGADEEERRA